jgi:hypothetical protein
MWGNALGWCISAVIVAATALGLIALQSRITTVSPTTELASAANGAALSLSVSPGVVLAPTDQADAGLLYRKAIEDFEADRAPYTDFLQRGTKLEASDLPALDHLLAAAKHGAADIFASHPETIITVRAHRCPELEALRSLGQCAVRIALLKQPSDPADAARYADAAFALGARLFEERLTLAELRLGIELIVQSARLIEMCNPPRAAPARQFADACRTLVSRRIDPMAHAIVTIDPAALATHTGDVFYFARNAQERMWRVESVLAIGRLRFNACPRRRPAHRRARARSADERPGPGRSRRRPRGQGTHDRAVPVAGMSAVKRET